MFLLAPGSALKLSTRAFRVARGTFLSVICTADQQSRCLLSCQEEPITVLTPRASPHHTRPRTARLRRTRQPGQKLAPTPGTRTALGPVQVTQGTRRLPPRRRQPSSRRSRLSPGSPARSSQQRRVMSPIKSLPQRRPKKPRAPPRAPRRSREPNQAPVGTVTQVPLVAPMKWKRRKTRRKVGKKSSHHA